MKWNFDTYGPVELVAATGKDEGSLILIKADGRSDPKYTFGADELEKLFQTMVNSDMPIRDPALVMFSDKEGDYRFPRASVEAEAVIEKDNARFNHTYAAWQLKPEAYTPTNFEMHVKFGKPSLWAFCDGFVTNGGRSKAPRAKLTFASAKAPAKPQTSAKANGPQKR